MNQYLVQNNSLYMYLCLCRWTRFLPTYMLIVFLHASAFLFSFYFLHKLWEYWIMKITQEVKSSNKILSPQSILVFDNVFFTQCFDLLGLFVFLFVKLATLRTWAFLVFLSLRICNTTKGISLLHFCFSSLSHPFKFCRVLPSHIHTLAKYTEGGKYSFWRTDILLRIYII